MRAIGIIIISAFVLFACKKGKSNIVLTGTAIEETYGPFLTEADIELYETIAGATSSSVIASGKTDFSGRYRLEFPRNQAESYTLKITKPNYFDINELVNFSDLSIEHDNYRFVKTTAKSWVALRFVNQSPSPTDVLKITRQDGKSGCDGCCPDGEQFLNGAVDTTIYFLNDGNTVFSYSYVDLSTTLHGIKSTTTVAFDTTEILLNY